MDHIRTIQELVDEHRACMPTGVATQMMKECQSAFEALPKLWKITFLEIFLDGDNDIMVDRKTMIAEETDQK